MPFRSRNIARELGTALTVATIYMLVLLAPLHQAAGLQRDLAQLGFTNLETWSVCQALAQRDSQPATALKCAVTGIGKNKIAPPATVATSNAIIRTADAVLYFEAAETTTATPWRNQGQPRGPPVTV